MREFLKGLELDTEAINNIMAEHGKYITNLKDQIDRYKTEIKSYKGEINGYKTTIDELNGKIETNNKSLENLQTITNERNDLKAQIQMSDSNVKKEFSKFVRSEVMANVKDDTDFTKALENYKKENPQYFGDTVVKKVQTSPTLNGGGEQPKTTNNIMNDILRSVRNN
jgi:chromosome segregation ATPase